MGTDERDLRRQAWDESASGWEAWFDTIERASGPVGACLVEQAAIGPGDQVLDIATGTGEPALTAARRVGPGGQVTGTDISPSMIAGARRRAGKFGVNNVSFRTMAVEDLDMEPGSFDAALCRWGLMFVPDLDDALGRIRRVVRPGGRFAAAAWAEATEVPVLSIEHQALAPYFEPGHFAHGFDKLNAFRLSQPGRLQSELTAAGFGEVSCERVGVVYEFASAAEYVRFRRAASSTAPALADRHPEDVVVAAWREVGQAVAELAEPDGRIRLENVALCAVGVA